MFVMLSTLIMLMILALMMMMKLSNPEDYADDADDTGANDDDELVYDDTGANDDDELVYDDTGANNDDELVYDDTGANDDDELLMMMMKLLNPEDYADDADDTGANDDDELDYDDTGANDDDELVYDDTGANDDDGLVNDISVSVSILENMEKCYESYESGTTLKGHVRSVKNGLKFLGKIYSLSMDGNLAHRAKLLVADVKNTLTSYEEETGVLDVIKLEHRYEKLRGKMRSLVTLDEIKELAMHIFRKDLHTAHKYGRIIDLLTENVSELESTWYINNNATADDQTTTFLEKVRELMLALLSYKPLCRCLDHPSFLPYHYATVVIYCALSRAAVAIYQVLVGEMLVKAKVTYGPFCTYDIMHGAYVELLNKSSSESSSDVKGQFYILDNLMHLLAMNLDSLNDANNHLYVNLRELQTFVANQRESDKKLNHYMGLTASTESICYQALHIVYSCYSEEVELYKDVRQEINFILIFAIGRQIKMIISHYASQEIKLYDYPRVDYLGFLEFFLGNLKELQGHEDISITCIRSDVEAIHTDIQCLMSSTNTSQEKLVSEGLWTDIVGLAYQAEFVIDLYLLTPDSRCISTLSNIVEAVKEIKQKLIVLPDKSLHVEDVDVTIPSHVHDMPPEVNHVFVGFQEEVYAIMKYLLGGEKDLKAISVVGMAGAGKTSLAKHVFKESSIVEHFDKKAWCTSSQSYNMKDLLLTILNQIEPFENDIENKNDEQLVELFSEKLNRSLRKRRYLVVIDDVWDVSLWNHLSRYLPNDKNQSRILITTRDQDVASKTNSIRKLRALTEEESWELLKKKLPQDGNLPENLVSIAKKVTKSCKGLPLSIVIVGGLMHNAGRNEAMWNQIAKDVTSTILNDPQSNCTELLVLSYNYLPNYLKSCFLYLGLFPEDHEISVTSLVRLWAAEGLVRGVITTKESAEDVGKRYVDDLISRSLVIPIKQNTTGGVKILQLHDLLHEFCLEKATAEQFLTVLKDKKFFDLSSRPRKISIGRGMYEHLALISLHGIRSILSFASFSDEIERIMESNHMMLLNVLDIRELKDPASYMHSLIHLRYLAIWKILDRDQVFENIITSKMWNLQTLILCGLNNEEFVVPGFIWDLVKLRHLHLLPSALFPGHDTKRVEDSPDLLENLKSLSKPRLHYGASEWVTKLPKLQKLSCIFFYSTDDIVEKQYRFPELDLCNRLTSLKVENGVDKTERKRCKLRLPASLTKLSLSGFILDACDTSEIGKSLPNLEVLKLHDSILNNWNVEDEEFPKLKALKISGGDCCGWDASEYSFPSLEQLWVESCSFESIPLSFGDIPCLRLISIKYCRPSVYESAKKIEKTQDEAQNPLKVIYTTRANY